MMVMKTLNDFKQQAIQMLFPYGAFDELEVCERAAELYAAYRAQEAIEGKALGALEAMKVNYILTYNHASKRYILKIHGKTFKGITIKGLIDCVREACEFHLKTIE